MLPIAETYGQLCGSKTVPVGYEGNIVSVISHEGVSRPERALGNPDYNLFNTTQASFSEGDVAVYDLQRFVPAGKTIRIQLIISLGDRMLVSSSRNRGNYQGQQTFYNDLALLPTPLRFNYIVPAKGIRYLRFKSTSGTVRLDGVTYRFATCLADADSDGVADVSDRDDDNDGISDLDECTCANEPSGDEDMDGEPAYMDSDMPGFTDSNNDKVNDHADHDLDGVPNHLDLDTDNDAMPDALEASGGILPANFTSEGRITPAYMAENDLNGDGMADMLASSLLAMPDSDGDGVLDYIDMDSDNDGLTDAREAGLDDTNNDGFVDSFVDDDGDGLTDTFDPDFGRSPLSPANTDGDGLPDYLDSDSDGDGVPDGVEANDRDMNGIADWDINNNGLVDAEEGGFDTNDNGLIDIFDPWAGAAPVSAQDTDSDGLPDYMDVDDDNDGIATSAEDTNGNGIFYDDFTAGQFGDATSTPDYLYDNFLVLPVKLISFLAEAVLGTVSLTWITANEQDNSHFEIERAGPSLDFESIGTVEGLGILGSDQLYTFTDLNPLAGTNYYRLKQVDNGGYHEYSPLVNVEVQLLPLLDLSMSVYPNPLVAGDELTIDLKNMDMTKPVLITITDLYGQVVYSETHNPASRKAPFLLGSGVLRRSGMYMVSVTIGDQTLTERLYILSLF